MNIQLLWYLNLNVLFYFLEMNIFLINFRLLYFQNLNFMNFLYVRLFIF